MANLKDLKNRIRSVKSTQKITSAMKLVAAAKLRRAQANAEQSRPYANRMAAMVADLAARSDKATAPKLLVGTGKEDNHLLVVVSADRGLCGGFNGSIIRAARAEIARCKSAGRNIRLLMVGRKAADALRREHGSLFLPVKSGEGEAQKETDALEGIQGTSVSFNDAARIGKIVQDMIAAGEIDTCAILFNRFISAINQQVTNTALVPAELDSAGNKTADNDNADEKPAHTRPADMKKGTTEYEPDEESVLADLLPRALSTRIFAAILESSASELAARMTAMDNATRNAGDLIDNLTMEFNRTRQAAITTELIEIISGAEAL